MLGCCWLVHWPGAAQAQDEEELSIAAPERVALTTDDGVKLSAYWYAGGVVRGKDGNLSKIDGDKVVPVIILHGWEGSSRQFSAIASYLQSRGHAVLVPDLRGHGGSKVMVQTRTGEKEKELDDFTAQDLALMAKADMIRIKRFLLEKNNARELNIELLCVLASEESSIVAANWVLHDWSYPDLLDRKQGKDVKGLILLSPVRMFNGYHWNDTMRQPVFSGLPLGVFTIPVLVITGSGDSKAYREAKTIHSKLKTSRKRLHLSFKEEDRVKNNTLYLVVRDTGCKDGSSWILG